MSQPPEPPPSPSTVSADEYFLEIESQFARLRETTFLFSSKDWALMKSWFEGGVPLPIVLEAMESCFVKRRDGGRRRTISSLAYCRHAVEELWSERKELHVGKREAVPEAAPGEAMTLLVEELRASAEANAEPVRSLLASAALSIASLSSGRSLPQLEEELIALEARLLDELHAALPESERASIEGELETQLRNLRADDAAFARTRAANLKRLLRSRYGMPRLSLFR